jgi:hypothetical protein
MVYYKSNEMISRCGGTISELGESMERLSSSGGKEAEDAFPSVSVNHYSLPTARVIRTLDQILEQRGKPVRLRNGQRS